MPKGAPLSEHSKGQFEALAEGWLLKAVARRMHCEGSAELREGSEGTEDSNQGRAEFLGHKVGVDILL